MKTAVLNIAATSLFLGSTFADDDPVTFNEHIQPIVHQRCASCHREGESAPFPLITYSDVSKKARTIKRVTADRYMPPWHADSSTHVFLDDRRLGKEEIILFEKWVEQGKQEGEPEKASAPPVFTKGWQLGEPDIIVKMTTPFEIPADGPDIYRNFAIPLNIPEDKWIKAIVIRPSVPAVLHHSLYFLDVTGEAIKKKSKDGKPGFKGMPFRKRIALGVYVPGVTPRKLPGDLARPLPKGADLILASHFHPTGKVEKEQSTVGIYLADKPPSREIVTIQVPPEFGQKAGIDVDPGDANFKIEEQYTVPVEAEIVYISGHAHYICKSMKMTATYPDGKIETLLSISDWDLDWQDTYYFKDKVILPKGTVLKTTIIYDNSADNPNNPFSPPKRIKWGKESTDEMGSITLAAVPTGKIGAKRLTFSIAKDRAEMFTDLAKELQQARVLDRFPKVINSLDKNADGSLSKDELPPNLKDALLKRLDTNGDEKLDSEEIEALRNWLKELRSKDEKKV